MNGYAYHRQLTCELCKYKDVGKSNCVPSRGMNGNPHIMFVGSSVNSEDDESGQTMSGKVGRLFSEILAEAKINPMVCRFANTVRCVPGIPQGRGQYEIEKPKPDIVKVCTSAHLMLEIAQQRPHMLVALGKQASQILTKSRASLDRVRGYRHFFTFEDDFIEWAEKYQGLVLYEGVPDKTGGIPPQEFNKKTCKSIEIPVVVTYHPSNALQKKGASARGRIEADLVYARKAVYNEPRLEGVDYRVVQSIDELNQWADYLIDYYKQGHTPWLSLDAETGGQDDKAGLREFDPQTEIVSLQVTWKDKHAILIPVSHPEGNFCDAFGIAAIRHFLKRVFVDEAIPAIGTNLPFDYKQIYAKFGLKLSKIAFDARFAHQCLHAGEEPNDLDYLSAKYCGMQGYGDGLKENLSKLPPGKKAFQNLPLDQAYVDYSCGDTDAVYRLAPQLIQELKDAQLWDTYEYCYRQAFIPMAEMEINGLPIDHDIYEWLKYEMPETIKSIVQPIKESPFYRTMLRKRGAKDPEINMLIDGTAPDKLIKKYEFNPGSTKQKVELLFHTMLLPMNPERVSAKTGDPSTDSDTMKELRDICVQNEWKEHLKVVESIREYTKLSKLHSAYIVNLPSVVPDKAEPKLDLFAPYWPADLIPWVCHPLYKLDGTQTGRLSSAQPAIHNMPGKSAVKRLFRSRWREQGGCHLQFDYGAMEVRILACGAMANCPVLKDAFSRGFDAHKYVASIIFQKSIEDVTPDERKVCKTVNFAVLYGAAPVLVAQIVGVTVAQAEKFIEDYLGALPAVSRWKAMQQKRGFTEGKVYSAFGRVRPLSKRIYSKGEIERRAVNTPIQSTASDVTLTSYIRIHERLKEYGFRSLAYLFVHDSLGFDIYPGEFFDMYEMLQYEMAEVPPQLFPWLDVPLEVDCDSGYSWGAMGNVQRIDRNHWKLVGKEKNCAALVNQLTLAGHPLNYQVHEEIVDGEPTSVWDLAVSR